MSEKIYPAGPGYEEFKKNVAHLTGVDLGMYKYQIHRRVHTLMKNWKISNYREYYDLLLRNLQKRRDFLDYITINVTEFFRNPERWRTLKEKVLPSLMERGIRTINIWSAGCSSGQEAYSLAILALESGLHFKLIAADVDEGALAKAQEGIYPASQLEKIPETLRESYFRPAGNEMFQVTRKVRDNVFFRRFNLLKDPFLKDQHLILCRNVVIYFSAETKAKLYEGFFNCLAPGGYLMVGSTEQIFGYSKLGFEAAGSFLYRKPSEDTSTELTEKRSLGITKVLRHAR